MNAEKDVDFILKMNKKRLKTQLEAMEKEKDFFYSSYLGNGV